MSRPDRVFDSGLQHERTALAWERTAVATMVAGTLLARFAQMASLSFLVPVGLLQVVLGALILMWTGRHYDELHGVLRAHTSPIHPRAARLVGLSTALFSGVAVAAATLALLT